jgi:ribosome-binding protein aMBF1 (putative translation factor)
MAKDWNSSYPGDEVVWKSINAVLQEACEQKGTTLDKVYKEISRKERPGHLRRVIGINLRTAREKVGLTREQVSKRSKVPVRRIILIEQARTDAGFLEWVRIAYALGIKPSKLAEAQEEIEKNLSQRKTGSDS